MKQTGSPLWLGVSKEKINPPLGEMLRGYPWARANDGIDSDLHARAMVFGHSARKPAAALVVLDTIQIADHIAAEIRRGICKRVPGLKPKTVMIAATHTHSAPMPNYFCDKDSKGKGVKINPRYKATLVNGAIKAVAGAAKKLRAVTVRHALGQAHLGHNRRVVQWGHARNEWEDAKGEHTGYFNPDVNLFAFDNAETGEILALISGYGCHPVTLGPGCKKTSGDYPGHYIPAIEKATGVELALHITTGAGNINPKLGLRDNPEETKKFAAALAKVVLGALPKARSVKLKPVTTVSVPVKFRTRVNMDPGLKVLYKHRIKSEHMHSEVQALRFGDFALVSAPGELFAEIATRVREKSPGKHTIIVEHCNDSISYIPTDTAILEGGYEALRGCISENMEQVYTAAALKALKA